MVVTDWCPIVHSRALAGDSFFNCDAPVASSRTLFVALEEEQFGASSKCFEASPSSDYKQALCLTTVCNQEDRTIEVSVGGNIIICDQDFDTKSLLADVRRDLPFDNEELGMEDYREDDFDSDM